LFERLWEPLHPIVIADFVFVFALTMVDGDTTRVDKGQDDGDRQGRSHRVPHRSGIDSFAQIKIKIPPYNGKYDPTAYLDWELEVEQQFSYHDISTNSQVQTTINEFTDFALM
jgi:hypothetical protein